MSRSPSASARSATSCSTKSVEQFGPCRAEEQDRRSAEVRDVLDEVEERRLCPVQVIEDERPLRGEHLQVATRGPLRLLFRPCRPADSDRRGDTVGHELVGRDGRDRVSLCARGRSHDLGERPVRDPLAVGEAAPDDDAGLPHHALGELAGQPRLADARGAEQRDSLGSISLGCTLERGQELAELLAAADERHVQRAGKGRRIIKHVEQPPRRDRLRLPSRLDGHHGLDAQRIARDPVCRVAEQDLPRRGGLLQPCGDVHGVAGDERLALFGDDLARIDADPQLDPKRRDLAPQLERRASRAQRVILVHGRDSEYRHHRVADELLHCRAVPLKRRARRLEVARHHPTQRLGIETFPHPGRPRDVREEDGDSLPDHAPSVGRDLLHQQHET